METQQDQRKGAAPGEKPLAGKRILVTRAREQAGALVRHIEALGGEAYLFPVIAFGPPVSWQPVDEAIASLDRYHWLVITSPNGVRFFMGRLREKGLDAGALTGLKVVAVGATTAKTLAEWGVRVDVIPREFRGAALPEAMAPYLKPGDRVLMPRGDLADPAHAQGIRDRGAVVDDLVVYRTVPADGDAGQLKADLSAGRIDYVTFTSGSTVRNLLSMLGGTEPLAGVRVAVIGQETRKAAEEAGLTVHVVAREASMAGLVDAIAADVLADEA